ncbi:transposase [Nonomuraea thailandensis]
MKALIEQARPELLTVKGLGVETAAQLLVTCGDNPDRLRSEGSFAALCGVSPVPASSGKTRRHRLNRGGDRQANRALYVVVLSRMSCDPSTRAYVERRTTDGLSKRDHPLPEAIRRSPALQDARPSSGAKRPFRLTSHRSIVLPSICRAQR